MPRVSPSRKKRIMSSEAYQMWLRYRRNVDPFPKDPFRAFQIDRSLRAKQEGANPWMRQPNRRDVRYDYPTGRLRRWKPRPTPRKHIKREKQKRARRITLDPRPTGIRGQIKADIAAMADFYNMPVPKSTLYARGGIRGQYNPYKKALWVNVGQRPEKAGLTTRHTALHEVGHYVHYASRSPIMTGKMGETVLPASAREQTLYGKDPEATLLIESQAWKLARRFVKKGRRFKKRGHTGAVAWRGRMSIQAYKERLGLAKAPKKMKWSWE